MRNICVLARNEEDGFFYRGNVRTSALSRRNHLVKFANSALPEKNISYRHIIPYGGAIPWNHLQVNDCVLTSVFDSRQREFFVPGLVVGLPVHCHREPRLYTILIYTHKHVCRPRVDIVWIGPDRYREILDNLRTKRRPSARRSSSGSILPRRRPQTPIRLGIRNIVKIKQVLKQRPVQPSRRPSIPRSTGSLGTRSGRNIATQTSNPDKSTPGRQPQERIPPTPLKPRPSPSLPRPPSHRTTSTDSHSTAPTVHEITLDVGTEVLARFPDDGWYYFGEITRTWDGQLYDVRDSTGHVEQIAANDVIDANNCCIGSKQPGDYVLALHPEYVFSYAPAKILSTYRSDEASLRFFDGAERKLPSNELYKIPPGTYRRVMNGIESCVIGRGDKTLVIRDDSTGVYKKMNVTVIGPSRDSNCLIIEDNVVARTVPLIHIFQPGRTESNREPGDWKHVLATADDNTYLPAKIVSNDPLRIQTCVNSEIRQLVSLDDCFYLNEMYYNNAVRYINHRNN